MSLLRQWLPQAGAQLLGGGGAAGPAPGRALELAGDSLEEIPELVRVRRGRQGFGALILIGVALR